MQLFRVFALFLLVSCSCLSINAQSAHFTPVDTLGSGFKTPPLSARPRVWWHWMNGNVSKEGITADLEWMKRVGIAGAQVFDVGVGTPQVVDHPIHFMTPEWKEAFRHAGAECSRLGLEMAMQSSGGWAESGSPWVRPQHAMKRVAFTDTLIRANSSLSVPVHLPLPPDLYIGKDGVPFYVDIKIVAIPVPKGRKLAEVVNLAEKAQYRLTHPDGQREPTPLIDAAYTIEPTKVIDVTSRLKPDGSLDPWPTKQEDSQDWLIIRIGYTLTGKHARAATAYSDGLEVDKLSAKHVREYIADYIGRLKSALGPAFGKNFQYLLMDSWEVGTANWTEDMIPEFTRRRGYDPAAYLPVLAGYVVGSPEISDRFLWDFRRTIADLVADAHYGVISGYVTSQGLKGVYAEAPGVECPTTADGLQAKGRVAIPMGEFVLEPWKLPGGRETNRADLKEAASAAHIYGKPLAGAEAFTTTETDPWAQSFHDLKPYADWAFSLGINRMVIHTSAQQPFADDRHKPGVTLGGAGQNYNRNNTWAEQSVAFNTYLSRCSYLLQQGHFVADVLYYYGEDAPVVVPYWKATEPHLPAGYDCDWINTEVLLQAKVINHQIILPSGLGYRVLVLPSDLIHLRLPVIQKLKELVKAGAILVAPHPSTSPSLMDYPAGDDSIRQIDTDVWGPYGGIQRYHQKEGHPFGKGIVYSGFSLEEVFYDEQIEPDFRHTSPNLDDTIVWIHRQTADADIYFVANQQPHPVDLTASFRVINKKPEFWDPSTGDITPAAYNIGLSNTTVPLHLDPRGSLFVVFRKPAMRSTQTMVPPTESLLTTLSGPWQLAFPPDWGAPPSAMFDSLISWTEVKQDGIKYFSGTATYSQAFTLPSNRSTARSKTRKDKRIEMEASALEKDKNKKIVLDLGTVKEIAEVFVNGQPLGIYWKPPFRVDITAALKPGLNVLEIKVTNLWPNRLIGDEQPSAKKYCFSLIKPFTKDSPLLPSGLLGPVKIFVTTVRRQNDSVK
jgi:hypothetical protein